LVDTNGHDQWLSLGDASDMLGVHPSTLRRWADSGRVPCQRTPGGHRRFNRQQLLMWVDGAQQAPVPAPVQTAVESRSWYRRLADRGILADLRPLGQRLSGVMVQYLLHHGDDSRYLEDAASLGRQYGAASVGAGVTLTEAVEAFTYYRSSLFPIVAQMVASDVAHAQPHLTRFEEITNQALLGLAAEYER
jgi:excisionase family DNA binding protein